MTVFAPKYLAQWECGALVPGDRGDLTSPVTSQVEQVTGSRITSSGGPVAGAAPVAAPDTSSKAASNAISAAEVAAPVFEEEAASKGSNAPDNLGVPGGTGAGPAGQVSPGPQGATGVKGVTPQVEMQCGELATCWLGDAPGQHPRCEAHRGERTGVNLTDAQCRAKLLAGVRG